MHGVVGAHSVGYQSHGDVGYDATDGSGKESDRRLERRETLHVLKEERHVRLDAIEDAPDQEDTDTNDAENTVSPERVWDHSWTAEFFLASDPHYEARNQSNCGDEEAEGSCFADLCSVLRNQAALRQIEAQRACVVATYTKQ